MAWWPWSAAQLLSMDSTCAMTPQKLEQRKSEGEGELTSEQVWFMLALHVHAKRDTGEQVPRASCPHCHALLAVQWYCWHLCAAVSHMLAVLLWLPVGLGRCWAGALNPLSSSPGCCFSSAASSCGCAPLSTVAAWLCCSPSTFCGAVLCCQSGKRREQAKKQRRKERSSVCVFRRIPEECCVWGVL